MPVSPPLPFCFVLCMRRLLVALNHDPGGSQDPDKSRRTNSIAWIDRVVQAAARMSQCSTAFFRHPFEPTPASLSASRAISHDSLSERSCPRNDAMTNAKGVERSMAASDFSFTSRP
jgi:hypothetical protein